jgi:hypothetical protein
MLFSLKMNLQKILKGHQFYTQRQRWNSITLFQILLVSTDASAFFGRKTSYLKTQLRASNY